MKFMGIEITMDKKEMNKENMKSVGSKVWNKALDYAADGAILAQDGYNKTRELSSKGASTFKVRMEERRIEQEKQAVIQEAKNKEIKAAIKREAATAK